MSNQIQEFGSVNKLSKEMLDQITPLEELSVVYYKLTGGVYDMVFQEDMFGCSKSIPLHDRIKDWSNGRIVEIGVPKEMDGDKITAWKKFIVAAEGNNMSHNGTFALHAGNVEHEEVYLMLEIMNANGSNKKRDTKAEIIFTRVDVYANEKAKEDELDTLNKALNAVAMMDKDDVLEFAAINNWDMKLPHERLKIKVKQFAAADPRTFLEKQGNPENAKMEKIKKAFDLNIISFVPTGADGFARVIWCHNSQPIAKLTDETGGNPVERFFNWTKQSGNGENTLKAIIKHVAGKVSQ